MAGAAETFEFEDAEVLVETNTGKFTTTALPGAAQEPRDLGILRQRASEALAAGASAASAADSSAEARKNPDDPIDRVQALLMGGRGLEADEVEFLDEARAKEAAKVRAAKRALEQAEDEFDAQLRSRVVASEGPVAGIEVRDPGNVAPPPAPPAPPQRLADPSPGSGAASSGSSVARLLKRPRTAASAAPRASPAAARPVSAGGEEPAKRPRQDAVASRALAALATYASDSSSDDGSGSD